MNSQLCLIALKQLTHIYLNQNQTLMAVQLIMD